MLSTVEFGRRKLVWAQLFPGGGGGWWSEYLKDTRHELRGVETVNQSARSWHSSKRPGTSVSAWIQHWRHCSQAFNDRPDGVVTHFPQLAVLAGARQFWHADLMIVAHNFNLGQAYGGFKQIVSRALLSKVDRFIVHSRGEVPLYSDWLDQPAEKFVFVPLQRASLPLEYCDTPVSPYIVAAGTAHRDYTTLMEAVRGTGIKTIIVAGSSAMDALRDLPENVEVRSGLTMGQCATLISSARIHVVPLLHTPTAAGQVAVVSGMRLGTPTIATRSVGTLDYIENRKNGVLVSPGDHLALRQAIDELWGTNLFRAEISKTALAFAEKNLSDSAAASSLVKVLDEVAVERLSQC